MSASFKFNRLRMRKRLRMRIWPELLKQEFMRAFPGKQPDELFSKIEKGSGQKLSTQHRLQLVRICAHYQSIRTWNIAHPKYKAIKQARQRFKAALPAINDKVGDLISMLESLPPQAKGTEEYFARELKCANQLVESLQMGRDCFRGLLAEKSYISAGRQPNAAAIYLIESLADLFVECGGRPAPRWSDDNNKTNSPFAEFLLRIRASIPGTHPSKGNGAFIQMARRVLGARKQRLAPRGPGMVGEPVDKINQLAGEYAKSAGVSFAKAVDHVVTNTAEGRALYTKTT